MQDNGVLVLKGKADFAEGVEFTMNGEVIIGKHVWIGAFAHFLKGSSIPDNCVASYRSLVTREFTNENVIIGGTPAKEIKEIVVWEK